MGAQKPGFWCDAWDQKPGFCENIRCDTQTQEKTRFLWS